jgi:hypothetical protein
MANQQNRSPGKMPQEQQGSQQQNQKPGQQNQQQWDQQNQIRRAASSRTRSIRTRSSSADALDAMNEGGAQMRAAFCVSAWQRHQSGIGRVRVSLTSSMTM